MHETIAICLTLVLRLARLRSLDHATHAKEAAETSFRGDKKFQRKHWALGKAQTCGQISTKVSKVLQVQVPHTAVQICTAVKHCVREASRHPVGSPDSCAVCGRPARTRLGHQPSS